MCHSQVSFPFHVTRKVPLRELPGRPTKRRPRGRVLEARERLPRPSRGRAGAAPRRIAPRLRPRYRGGRRRPGAARARGAPEPRRPGAVLGTRGRGHLPASTAPPARSVPLGIPTRRSADGEPPSIRVAAIKIARRHSHRARGH